MNRKIFNNLCTYAQKTNLDKLVISAAEKNIIIDGYQKNGTSRRFLLPKKLEQEFFINLQKILAISPGELMTEKRGKIKRSLDHLNYRLSVLPDNKREKIIINIIKPSLELWRLEQLGLSRADLKNLKLSCQKKSGLIIISSPPAQGKSSTLRALLLYLNSSDLSIYSLEDHPPYKLPGVSTMSARPENLERILRQDSDCLLIDNLDQPALLKGALRAAASGRLVIGSLTADNSWEALQKVWQINLPARLKLDSLKLIINQRLAKLSRQPKINNSNHRQLIGLFELFKLSPTLKNIILTKPELNNQKFLDKLKKTALKEGFRSWEDDKNQKIKEGLL